MIVPEVMARISPYFTPDIPDKSGFPIRIYSEIPVVMARISPHFTSGFSGRNRISHPDCFGDPRGDCPDFSASNIRINPELQIRKCSKTLFSKQATSNKQAKQDFSAFRIRIVSEIPELIARISPHLTPG